MSSEDATVVTRDAQTSTIETPQVWLELKTSNALTRAPGELSLTLPFRITPTLRIIPNSTDKSFVLRWNLFSVVRNGDLQLLHITPAGPEEIAIEFPEGSSRENEETLSITRERPQVEEISPSAEMSRTTTLPGSYQRKLKAGETYQLRFRGRGIHLWDWGTKEEHFGKELKSCRLRDPPQPPLVIPPSESVSFIAREEAEPWPERPRPRPSTGPEYSLDPWFLQVNEKELLWRMKKDRPPSPPPLGLSDRIDGAPVLSLKMACPQEWTKNATVKYHLTVTYDATTPTAELNKPITFHKSAFAHPFLVRNPREGLRLYKDHGEGTWKRVETEDGPGCSGFAIFDAPPIPVKVGNAGKYDSEFVTLHPGESWTHEHEVQGPSWTSLPVKDLKVGDKFKYLWKGATVDWWDWGTKDDHRETEVKLRCNVSGSLEEPKDNDGRPKLVVPASNEAHFTFVG